GHLQSAIHCASHSLTYSFDGRLVAGKTPGDLTSLEMMRAGPLILARAVAADPAAVHAALPHAPWEAFATLVPRTVTDLEAVADWKLMVEQRLESPQAAQHFLAPNLLPAIRPDGALTLQVTPLAPGRCRLRRFDFAPRGARAASGQRAASGPGSTRQRRVTAWLKGQIELAESTQ